MKEMNEWKEYKLSDIADFNMGQSPESKFYNFEGIGLPFLQGNRTFGYKFPTFDTFCTDPKKIANQGEILFSVRAPVGDINIAYTDICIGRGLCSISLKNGNNLFLYYLLHFIKKEIINAESGTVFGSVNRNDLENILIRIPESSEQIQIASILSSLDDKIDLLHRQNKTLEQLAETLFRQWFVEEAENSWEEVSLSDIAIHFKQNVNPSKSPNAIFIHYSLPAFDDGKEPQKEIGKDILSGKYHVVSNSVLISKLNPRTPRIWGLFGSIDEENAICSTEFQIVKPKDIKWYCFIYCYLKSYKVAQELKGAASGTSGSHQRVNPQDIFNLTFRKPPKRLVDKFDDETKDSFQKIKSNTKQIRTLTQLRDTLLPKLMSGEVRVKN